MSEGVLTLLKFVLLALLYLFLARALRTVIVDVYGPRRRRVAVPRPPVVQRQERPSPRRRPRELVIHPPEGRPVVVRLGEQPLVFGRSPDADVVLTDRYVSEQHAAILPDGDGWVVRDLGSTNGTFLNGARVSDPTPLAAGDHIRMGKTRVEVRR